MAGMRFSLNSARAVIAPTRSGSERGTIPVKKESIGEISIAPAIGRDFGNSRRAGAGERTAVGALAQRLEEEAGPTAPRAGAPYPQTHHIPWHSFGQRSS